MGERICSTEGCDKPSAYVGLGICARCYYRIRRYGDPNVFTRIEGDDERRFLSKVQKVDIGHSCGPCWVWTGSLRTDGYGHFWADGRFHAAHRWAYEHWIGPIPTGLHLDHFACDYRGCASPFHVRPVTQRENNLRSNGAAARNRAKTHCPQGHPYDAVNTGWTKRGTRWCRQCNKDYKRRARRAA